MYTFLDICYKVEKSRVKDRIYRRREESRRNRREIGTYISSPSLPLHVLTIVTILPHLARTTSFIHSFIHSFISTHVVLPSFLGIKYLFLFLCVIHIYAHMLFWGNYDVREVFFLSVVLRLSKMELIFFLFYHLF